jgi:hypothetical protein
VNDAFGTTPWLFQDVCDVTFIVFHRVVCQRHLLRKLSRRFLIGEDFPECHNFVAYVAVVNVVQRQMRRQYRGKYLSTLADIILFCRIAHVQAFTIDIHLPRNNLLQFAPVSRLSCDVNSSSERTARFAQCSSEFLVDQAVLVPVPVPLSLFRSLLTVQ